MYFSYFFSSMFDSNAADMQLFKCRSFSFSNMATLQCLFFRVVLVFPNNSHHIFWQLENRQTFSFDRKWNPVFFSNKIYAFPFPKDYQTTRQHEPKFFSHKLRKRKGKNINLNLNGIKPVSRQRLYTR